MAMEPRHQIAICYLLLKGEHWIPVSPERRLTANDRSSPDGPAITAEVIGEVEDNRVSGWRKVGSLIQNVGLMAKSSRSTPDCQHPLWVPSSRTAQRARAASLASIVELSSGGVLVRSGRSHLTFMPRYLRALKRRSSID